MQGRRGGDGGCTGFFSGWIDGGGDGMLTSFNGGVETEMLARLRAHPDKALLVAPLLIAVILAVWQTRLEYGWLEMALGERAWLFWGAALLWAVLVGAAIRRHRAWWLVLTAPIVLYPVVISAVLLAGCARGDCL